MMSYMVTWLGMPEGQEFYCRRLDVAKRIARAYAIVYDHAEITSNTIPCREIQFDRTPQYTVNEVEM